MAILDRDDEKGEALAKELGSNAAFFLMDATEEDTIKKAVEDASNKFGGIHGCVASAGVGSAATIVGKKPGQVHDSGIFDFVQKVNVYGVFNVNKYCASEMLKNEPDQFGLRGVLVNVASVAAQDGQKGQVAYAASKGAVQSMTLPMARDLGRHGVRVITILPGSMETPLMAAASDKVKQGLAMSIIAPKRLGLPEEFANLVATCIDNSYLNGVCIRLDGGIRMPYTSKI